MTDFHTVENEEIGADKAAVERGRRARAHENERERLRQPQVDHEEEGNHIVVVEHGKHEEEEADDDRHKGDAGEQVRGDEVEDREVVLPYAYA